MKPLSKTQIILYAFGQLGWATLLHVIYTLLVYFYLPPTTAGLPTLITEEKFFGVLSVIVLIAAAGRIMEAFTDPLIAGFSDRATWKAGRRIPFMAIGMLPAAIACALMFMPPDLQPTTRNIYWLLFMQLLFYPAFSMYAIPHWALLIELGHDSKQRLNLATFNSVAWALSSLTSALVPWFATMSQNTFNVDRLTGYQYGVVFLCALSFIWMALPVIFISEKKHSSSYGKNQMEGAHQPVFESLKLTFKNKKFLQFVTSDCCYWMGLNIVTTGMLYYITVLLELREELLGTFMAILLLTSFALYPIVNLTARIFSKKSLMLFGFIAFAAVFGFVFFGLGRVPLPPFVQAVIVMVVAAIPLAFLGVIPNTVLAEIAELDMLKTGVRKEGMYFAARTMIMKLGQTFGIILFTILLTFGRERGHDLGIRLSAFAGLALCLFAAAAFLRYNEKETSIEIERIKAGEPESVREDILAKANNPAP